MTNRRERRAAAKAGRAEAKRQRPPGPDPTLAEATRLYQSGRHEEAERVLRPMLSADRQNPHALYLLGMVAIATARPELAESSLAAAAARAPQEPAVHNGIALLRAMQGRFAEALASHDRALAIDPADVGALIGRGLASAELGDLAAAERSLGRARAIAPRSIEAVRHHATALAALGRREEAARAYGELVALDPEFALARLQLVELLCDLGRAEEALDRALEGMRGGRETQETAQAFALALARRLPAEHDPEVVSGIERCFDMPGIDRDALAKPAALQLRARYGLDAAPVESAEAAVEALLREEAPPVLADSLLDRLLAETINRDPFMERFLTAARRHLGLAAALPAAAHPFLASLALQCFNNTYVFALSAEEEQEQAARLGPLEAELSQGVAPGAVLEGRLLRHALYAPLASLGNAAALAEIALDRWSPHFRRVIERTLLEPLEEQEIAATIPSLGVSENTTSQAVGQQYEEHPYPRWLALPQQPRTRLSTTLRQKFPHARVPEFLAGPLDILVAGAGTGIQPITTALALEGVEVLAVDLSRASLAYAARMARRLGAANLEFLQGDLLRLGELGRSFPVIEAVGVLHHLQSPLEGWRVLAGMLRPQGWMRVALYSAAARAEVAAARERIAALGLSPSPAEIRSFRERVLFGAEAAEFPTIALSNDIWDLSGCRDLLFHACEHRFTLPELQAMLAELELDFVGFEHEVAAIPAQYRADHPDDPTMTDLGNWAAFEAAHPDAFPMYVFWCAKP